MNASAHQGSHPRIRHSGIVASWIRPSSAVHGLDDSPLGRQSCHLVKGSR